MTLKKLISVVLPGVLLVLANFLFFAKQFRALDFPAFDLPAKTNSKPSSGGAFFIFNTYFSKPEPKDEKNELMLKSLEDAVKSLKDSLDDAELYEGGTFAEMNDEVVMIPDCVVIVGKSSDESYVIPFAGDQNIATPEGRAFQSALRVMKENGVKLRVLKPKSNTSQQLRRNSKSAWNFSSDSDISLQFPDNFVSLN